MAIQIEKVAYGGWQNCYRMTNGEVELVMTSDIGPRIMRYSFSGGQNMFWEQASGLGKSGEATWQLRGGHRIWVGPEDIKYTYSPDNGPVSIEQRDSALIATQPMEPDTRVRKQIIVKMNETGTGVTVLQRLQNCNPFPLEFAAWSLSMMAPGGLGITGFPPRGTHPEVLPPTHPLIMWAFTNLADPRWRFTRKYLMLRQDPALSEPQKLGHFNPDTWGAYQLGGDLFLKRAVAYAGQAYPDLGSSFEIFANADFLELETLGPMTRVPADGWLEHTEFWTLSRGIDLGDLSDNALDAGLLPLLK